MPILVAVVVPASAQQEYRPQIQLVGLLEHFLMLAALEAVGLPVVTRIMAEVVVEAPVFLVPLGLGVRGPQLVV